VSIACKLLIRDVSWVVASVLMLRLSHQLEGTQDPLALPVAIAAGIMIPVAGLLAHEWGHWLGAWHSRGIVHMPASVWTVFLFDFRPHENSREQFLSVSAGGFIASALMVLLLVSLLSTAYLADRIALGLTILGVIATFVLEIPPAWRVYRGGALPG
jgi:hypothetical protein